MMPHNFSRVIVPKYPLHMCVWERESYCIRSTIQEKKKKEEKTTNVLGPKRCWWDDPSHK